MKNHLNWFPFLRVQVVLGILIATACSCVAESNQPNILVILLDDAGYADFGFMGCKDLETPNIDRLAKSGTVFTDAHVTATVCSPSRAGLLTGRYQQRFGHECNLPPPDSGMAPSELTIGDLLKPAGYRTIAIGKWHLGNSAEYHPNVRGFDEFFGFVEGGRTYFPDPKIDHPGHAKALQLNGKQVDFDGYLTDVLTDKAIECIGSPVDAPFFMYLAYNAVHTPMEATEQDLARYAGHPRQQLAAMTWNVDYNIGRVMDALEDRQMLANTLIFFLSDNGGSESNQSSCLPLKGWKGNKYEGGHRVPFIVSWPGRLPGGKVIDALTSALDIAATSLDISGINEPPVKPLDGVSLIPLLTGKTDEAPHQKLFWRKDKMAAMRDGKFKLVRLEGAGYRMYDIGANIGETVDLRESNPGQFLSMQQDLAGWEAHLSNPLWIEGKAWSKVTYQIHLDLMHNREVLFKTPSELNAAQNK